MSIIKDLNNIIDVMENDFYDIKTKNLIIINLHKIFYLVKFDTKNNNIKDSIYLVMEKIIRIINIFVCKNKYKYIYLRKLYRSLIDIKIYINNDIYLKEFIKDCKKIKIAYDEIIHYI